MKILIIIHRLNEFEKFHGIVDHFVNNLDKWQEYCDWPDPQNRPLPEPWDGKLSPFEV